MVLEYLLKYRRQLMVVTVVAIPCIVAYITNEITLVKAILLTIFASLTALSFFTLVRLLEKIPLGIQRSAPAIDGSISGWRFTHSLTHSLITCVFAVATLIVYMEKPKSLALGATDAPLSKDSLTTFSIKKIDSLKTLPKDSTQSEADTYDSTK